MRPAEGKRGYELRDASRLLVLAIGVGLVVLTVAALFLMKPLLDFLEEGEARRQPEPTSLAAGETPAEPPPPRLEVDPGASLRAMLDRERETLESYGWTDPEVGVVRIPIARAMELIVERGLPVRSPGEAASAMEGSP